MKIDDYVLLCQNNKGYLYEDNQKALTETHFENNSIGIIRKIDDTDFYVYLIGIKDTYIIKKDQLTLIDVLKTGKGFDKKICNLCYLLKNQDDFSINQTDSKGKKVSRPSCKDCRKNKIKISASQKREKDKEKPLKGTLWKCPICLKRSIVGVTAKVVLDHDHNTGNVRTHICDSCNTGLGRFQNGKIFLDNAIAYVEGFKTKKK